MKKLCFLAAASMAFVVVARQPTPWERIELTREVARVPSAAKVPFKLGVARWTFHTVVKEQGLQKVLETLQALDCHYLGLVGQTLDCKADAAEIASFKSYLASYGVQTVTLGPDEVSTEADARPLFEFAKRYGMKVISVLPCEKRLVGGKEILVESDTSLDMVENLVKEYDIKVAIHNHGPDMPELYPTAESVWERIKDRDPRVGLCFDMGHEQRAGFDPVAAIRKYGSRIYDVHLKNIKLHPICNLALPGPRGELDIPKILQALVDVGYSGVCHIEYEKDFCDPSLGLAESIGYYRGVMDMLKIR